MPYDEAAAEQATAALAATTDELLVADVRAGLAEVVVAQRAWRGSESYPARGNVMRPLFDGLDRLITDAGSAVRALSDDAPLRAVVALVSSILGAYVPARPELAGAVCEAVDRLRWLAISRPSLVDDARRLAQSSPGSGE
jgi:hypothetical protein